MCAFDGNLQVVAWNEAAEALTGIPPREALGRPCWAILGGTADDGSLICHRGCSGARLARQGWPVAAQTLNIRTRAGRRRVAVDTVSAHHDACDFIVHLFRPAPKPGPSERMSRIRSTPRRLEVLRLLSQGLTVRRIATRLGVKEATVRNHIHGLLVDLDAHCQLEAVAKARSEGLV
jgi:DNA-binding CsgD family transcriptional regulator